MQSLVIVVLMVFTQLFEVVFQALKASHLYRNKEFNSMSTVTFSTDMAEKAMHHMNEDHAATLLAYARVLAGCSWAESAEMTAIDAHGCELLVRAHGREETHRIPFPEPATDAAALRQTFIQLAQQADVPDGRQHTAVAEVATPKASRYLKALCNHFARKVTATYDDNHGRVNFPFGDCQLQATDSTLHLTVTAESEAMFIRTKEVVADHLVRFSANEELIVTWVDAPTPTH